ncbi:Elongation factor Ts [Heracleum sosnowskyi]|uniref:Elongation factor Ts n=1 Tax=Heracleum sosnowskyi TaxID=360622 RepID=A0AAD8N6T7_9APIA|nr:Elongation factor Ts [Heracleum sosnowskyi]
MGSNYYGDPKQLGGGGGGSSSRKGKKSSSSSDKPKQPQRGLGVAQLEKIRLHTQMASANFNIPNPNYPFTNPFQEDVRVQTTAYSSASSSSFSYRTPTSASYGFQPAQNIMMGLGDSERANVRYGDSQPTTNNIARWNAGNASLNPQYYQQPYITRNLIDLEAEELTEKKKKTKGGGSDSMGSGSQNSGSSESQELDLELRLSL